MYFVSVNLEFAYLSFCEGFRKEVISNPKRVSYSANEFDTSSDTYTALEKALQVPSFNHIVDMLLQKMITPHFNLLFSKINKFETQKSILILYLKKYSNIVLKYYCINLKVHSSKPELVELTLEFLRLMISDSSMCKKLIDLPSIQYLLKSHTEVITYSTETSMLKHHTEFYQIISTLVICQDVHTHFFPFLSSFDFPLQRLLASDIDAATVSPRWKIDVQNLFSILIGVLKSIHNTINFEIFFDWLYPEPFKAIQQTFRLYPNELSIHKYLLKFILNLTNNESRRLKIDNLNGFILFKESCPILLDALSLHENFTVSHLDLQRYPEKMNYMNKLLTNVLQIEINIIEGHYVHFGILELYSDECFIILAQISFQRLFALNLDEFSKFKKAEYTLYNYLFIFLRSHAELALLHFDIKFLIMIINIVMKGLNSENDDIIKLSCHSVDELYSFIFKEQCKSRKRLQILHQIQLFLPESQTLSSGLFQQLLRMMVYEEGDYIYALANPVYSLMLIHKDSFDRAQEELLSYEKSDSVRVRLYEKFQNLLNGIDFAHALSGRDKFFSNFSQFKNSLREII